MSSLRAGRVALLTLALTSAAQAATFTFEGGGSTTAPTSGNFSGTGFSSSLGASASSTPISTTVDTLVFAGTAYTATDDFTTTVQANALNFSNSGVVSLATKAGANNSITLGGTAPAINLANAGALTINLNVILGATLTLSGTNAGGTAISGNLSDGGGNFGLTMSAGNLVTLNGTNTFGGTTTINSGVLKLNSAGALNGTGNIVFGGGTLRLSGSFQTDFSSRIVDGAGAISVDTNTANVTFASNITSAQTGGLSKAGAGTLTLIAANTYSGNTALSNGGTLRASGAVGTLPSGSPVVFNTSTGAILSIHNDAGGTINQGNNISSSATNGLFTVDVGNNGGATAGSTVAFGALANNATGLVNFTGANGYTQSYSSLALPGGGGGTVVLNPTTTSVAVLGATTNQLLSTALATTFDTLYLNGTSTGNSIAGVISDGANFAVNGGGSTRLIVNGAITVSGAAAATTSVWTLTGANTYHGATTINGGALIINGTSSTTGFTSNGTGAVAVNSGGTLLGNGTAPAGMLTVASGGNLAPGATVAANLSTAASPGVLTVGALTLNAGANFNVLLNDNASTTGAGAGTSYSQLVASGVTTLAGNLNITIGSNLAVGDEFFILLNSSGSTTSPGTFANISGTTFTTGGDTFTINYGDTGDSTSGNDISLTVAAVPEPGTRAGAILCLAIMGFTLRGRIGARFQATRRSQG